ncbi:polyprenyl synthetase family protein [Streptomyces massasporeus]|uniref:polyprenyl synthetase family protein n=1 Tax=Streptomyces massasporeus TaxID=67324 RepID=UPI0036F69C53
MTREDHMVAPTTASQQQLDMTALRLTVEETLFAFLQQKACGADGPLMTGMFDVLRDFLGGGGKRVRPLYCCLGWSSVENAPMDSSALRAAAGLELFHTFALVHDDLIDGSELRHDRPTAHRAFAALGPEERAAWFGESAAVLLGDLCEVWSAELLGVWRTGRNRRWYGASWTACAASWCWASTSISSPRGTTAGVWRVRCE